MNKQVATILITTNEQDISALETDVSTLQTDLNTAEASITTLQSDVNAVEATVSTLVTDVNTAEAAIDAVEAEVDTLQTEMDAVQADLVDADSAVTALSTDLDEVRYGLGTGLQTALTNDKANAVELLLATGTVSDTTTVNIVNGSGGGIRGMGRLDPLVNPASTLAKNHSTRLYTGTKSAGTKHILWEVSDFFVENCSFLGQPYSDIYSGGGTKTPIGIQMNRASGDYAGIGTGKGCFRGVTFAGYDVAIDRAPTFTDSNCDENSYYDILFARCGIGFRSGNLQGLSDKFYNLRAGNTPVVFDYISGGKLSVTDVTLFSNCTLLRLNNDQPTGYGPNNSRWVFRGVDLDSQARNSKLLDCDTAGIGIYGHILFEGGHLCRNGTEIWDNECWHMGEIGLLTIRDFMGLQAGMIKVTSPIAGAKTTIIVEDCVALKNYITDATDLIHPDSFGTFRLIVRNLLEVDSTNLLVEYYNELITMDLAIANNLVAGWNLDTSGTEPDLVGSNDLTESSGTIPTTTGKVSTCRDFEAGDTECLVTAGDSTELSTGDVDFAMCCWINTESTPSNSVIAHKGWQSAPDSNREWILYAPSASSITLAVDKSGATQDCNHLVSIANGTWYFVFAWHDSVANTLNIQVNNGTVSTQPYSLGVNDGNRAFVIGASVDQSLYWDGQLEKFFFWKGRIPSSTERGYLYNSGAGRLTSEWIA